MINASNPHHFTGVHQIMRIERQFDGAHDAYRFAMFGLQKADFTVANAMFAGACAVHGQGAQDQALVKRLAAGDFIGVIRVKDQQGMEISIPDMADDRSLDAAFQKIAFGFCDTFSRREIGTQTSVGMPFLPGCMASDA